MSKNGTQILVAILGASAIIVAALIPIWRKSEPPKPESRKITLAGKVYDSQSHDPIPSADVELEQANQVPGNIVPTDSRGNFLFQNISNDPAKLQVTANQYLTIEVNVNPAIFESVPLERKQVVKATTPSSTAVTDAEESTKYLEKLSAQPNTAQRAQLIGALDSKVPAPVAISTAMYYAQKSRETNSAQVFDQSTSILRKLAPTSRDSLVRIENSTTYPDADIARALLGEPIKVKVRISQVDDFAHFDLKGQTPISLTFGQDSDWIDITNKLIPGNNTFKFRLDNGPYGGFGVRVEISAGTQQYDSGAIYRNTCPCNKPAMEITGALLVASSGISEDGSITIQVKPPNFFAP